MEKDGLVRRTRSETDNRTVLISVTDAGAKATEVCTRLSNLVQERISEKLCPEELTMLSDGLKRVFDVLEDIPSLENLAQEYSELAAE